VTVRADLEAAMDKTPKAKMTKRQAGYGGGLMAVHCALCREFLAPDACKIVEGEINPQAWCRYFEPKRQKD
jgi:hypothetical protein